jgi:hypothetical protein
MSMKIYRIENEKTMHGMWYRGDGTFDPFILRLTEGKSKDLPMGFNERYYKERLKWYSGAGSIEDMQHWFSARDALELYQNGYKLYEFQSKQFNVVEHEIMFTREGILSKQEIPLETIWEINKLK